MPKVLTEAERDRLVDTPDERTRLGKRDRALLSIMAYGGLRIAEACGLTRENITREGGRMRLTFTGKGGHSRTVSLPSRASSAVDKWLMTHTSPYVFPARGGPLKPRGARQRVYLHAEAAGLPDWVHPHTLRHTFGSTVQRKLGDLFLTARVMGHRSVKTTADYYLAFDATYADKAAEVF